MPKEIQKVVFNKNFMIDLNTKIKALLMSCNTLL